MKIVIDENITYAEETFSKLGDVVLLPGRKITNKDLTDADALIVRSVTKVDKTFLQNTKLKFVGTATIGTDHIDKDYLSSQKISFADAAGCNADAVTEYVFTSIYHLAAKNNFTLKNKTIGIVGVGNIGSRVSHIAKALGMNVLLNDPPLKRKTNNPDFKYLSEVLKADIITIHVPLNLDGIDKTFHLFDKKTLLSLNDGCILINASRGEVVDNKILSELIPQKKFSVVLDVWENEPDLNSSLLEKVIMGTPHIAGYSFEGKVNGTKMMYDSFCRHLNIPSNWKPEMPRVENEFIETETLDSYESTLNNVLSKVYNIENDDNDLRKVLMMNDQEKSKHFDLLRKNYPFRREFNNYTIKIRDETSELKNILAALRFKVI
ncbi:MAG: 4-phosphoerythronate dehydrogenase [Ignavibacteriales bacterium]|nr:MAG: 4-phosphoerythronate dehydrogenase [Ignavibacteriales bacterium]